MRGAGHEAFRAEAANGMACGIEARVGSKLRLGATVTVGRVHLGKVNANSGDISGAEFHVAEIMVEARGVTGDVAVPKIAGDSDGRDQLRLIAGRERGQILLEAIQIDDSVGRDVLASSIRDNE